MSWNPRNAFRDLDRPREVFAWGMYDLANQSFQLLINTLLFAVYIRSVVMSDEAAGDRAWGLMTAAALLLIVFLSPIVGAVADAKAWKREILLVTGFGSAALTAALGLVGRGDLALAVAIYIPAAVLCGLGENFLGSFLPEISTRRNIGRVSAIGWTMSYVGALLLLGCVVAAATLLGRDTAEKWRPLFVFGGVWFLAGVLPAAALLRERAPAPRRLATGTIVGAGFGRLAQTVRHARQFRQLVRFLIAFFVYSMGTQVFIFLAGVMTRQLNFSETDLFIVALETTLLAGVGAVFAGRLQDRIGHRRMISFCLLAWIVSMGGLTIMAFVGPTRGAFYTLAAISGLGLGGLGTASRALIGALTPEGKAGEFFGLWGMTFKLSGVAAMGSFFLLRATTELPTAWFLLLTTACFTAGLLLLRFVDEREGIHAAHPAPPSAGAGPGAAGP